MAVKPVLAGSGARSRGRGKGRPWGKGIEDGERGRGTRWGMGGRLYETVSTRIDLWSAGREDGGNVGEIAAPIEVLLYGFRHKQAIDSVNDAIRANNEVRLDDGGEIDSVAAGLGVGKADLIAGEGAVKRGGKGVR